MPQADAGEQQRGGVAPARRWRPRMMQVATLAAVLAAVVVGISIDRWILAPGHPTSPVASVAGSGSADRGISVSYVTDPRYLRERAELLRTLDARLAKLPPPTRKKVLQSLATIHQSMHDIQQALGREPGNALLQELLIDTYQDEMQVLSTVQQASSGSGES
jgi:negative regulator of sigma E activity